jgi:hypothetical protein
LAPADDTAAQLMESLSTVFGSCRCEGGDLGLGLLHLDLGGKKGAFSADVDAVGLFWPEEGNTTIGCS